jgi:hypothetical protein
MDFGFTPFTVPAEDSADAALHPLEWDGLCARLAAERDLRRALSDHAPQAGAASFAPALSVAWRGPWPDAPGVNPAALANGKAAAGMGSEAGDADRADLGGQE